VTTLSWRGGREVKMPTGIYDHSHCIGKPHRKKETHRCNFCKQDKPRDAFRVYGSPRGLRLDSRCIGCYPEYRKSVTLNRKNRNPDPIKNHARDLVKAEIRKGIIIPQPCEECGDKGQAHHKDYSKPLEVTWLCVRHHAEQHRAYAY
jgi:hypothetical protein